jgi:hypothetical protein
MFQFLIPAAVSLFAANRSAKAAKEAAATTAASTDRATALQRQMYEEGVARQQPFLQTGTEFFNQLAALQRGGPSAAQNFLQMDPGYAFRLGEGMKALERSAAARGGLVSGATMKGLQRYGQDLASQEYGAAYNRLAGLANVGPRAAGVMSDLGQTYATNVGNLMVGQGQTAANALLARGSAYQRGAGDIASLAGRYYGGYGGYGRQPGAPIYEASPSYMPVMDENLP